MPGIYRNPNFALRIPRDLLDKIKYIAEANGRSATREIELLVRSRVAEYEREHGKILIDDDDKAE